MKGSRRDWNALAQIFKSAHYLAAKGYTPTALIEVMVCDLADLLQQSNPHFERETFLVACGILKEPSNG